MIRPVLDLLTLFMPGPPRTAPGGGATLIAERLGDIARRLDRPAPGPDDPIRRFEAYYEYAKSTYEAARSSWERADAKASGYGAVLALILGASVFGLDAVAASLLRRSPADYVFLVATAGVSVTALGAVWSIIGAITLRDMDIPPTDDAVTRHFEEHDYVTVLYSVGNRYLAAAAAADAACAQKYLALGGSLRLIRVAIIFSVIAAAASVYARAEATAANGELHVSNTAVVPAVPSHTDTASWRPPLGRRDRGTSEAAPQTVQLR